MKLLLSTCSTPTVSSFSIRLTAQTQKRCWRSRNLPSIGWLACLPVQWESKRYISTFHVPVLRKKSTCLCVYVEFMCLRAWLVLFIPGSLSTCAEPECYSSFSSSPWWPSFSCEWYACPPPMLLLVGGQSLVVGWRWETISKQLYLQVYHDQFKWRMWPPKSRPCLHPVCCLNSRSRVVWEMCALEAI